MSFYLSNLSLTYRAIAWNASVIDACGDDMYYGDDRDRLCLR